MKNIGKLACIVLMNVVPLTSHPNRIPIDNTSILQIETLEQESEAERDYDLIKSLRKRGRLESNFEGYNESFDYDEGHIEFEDFPVEDWKTYITDSDKDYMPDGMYIQPPQEFIDFLASEYRKIISQREEVPINGRIIIEDKPLKEWKISVKDTDKSNVSVSFFVPDKPREYLIKRSSEILKEEHQKRGEIDF